MIQKKAVGKPRVFRWKPVPRSRANNAYDLLKDVQKAILEEPLRYNQGEWGVNLRTGSLSEAQAQTERMFGEPIIPACGTIACVAGWTVALRGGSIGGFGTEDEARSILGYGAVDYEPLFRATALHELARTIADRDGLVRFVPPCGSPDYAELGVRHIQRFMDANEAALKVQSLPPIRARKKG